MKKKAKERLKLLTAIVLGLALGLGIISAFAIQSFVVHGTSMFPYLENGDVTIAAGKYLWSEIELHRDDVVFLEDATLGKTLVKRLIALPGDHIVIKNGYVLLNGHQHNNPNVLFDRTLGDVNLKLGDDEYFVLGDNRVVSYDSRAFGPVSRNIIKGRIILQWRPWTVP